MKTFAFGFIALSILATPAFAGSTAHGCTQIDDSIVCDNGNSYLIKDGAAQPEKTTPSTLGDFAKAAPAPYAANYQSVQPAPTTPGTQDCYSLGSENLGCAPRNQLPPGLVLQNGVVRTRTTTASDGSYGREVATFVAGAYGRWDIASRDYPPAADSSAPSQDCGFLHLGCVRVYGLTETPGGRCRTYTYYHESRYGRTKSRSRDYRVSCY